MTVSGAESYRSSGSNHSLHQSNPNIRYSTNQHPSMGYNPLH